MKAGTHSESSQTSTMELCIKVVHGWKFLPISTINKKPYK